jgi:excisionase family DNA binding protein
MAKAPLIDSTEVATRLGTTQRHVRRLVAERRIPFVKVGRLVKFDVAQVEAWVEQNTVPAVR